MNGHVVYNSARAPNDMELEGQCVDVNGQKVLCCSWQVGQ